MATKTSSAKSLYTRLGGYDAIAAIVDEFLRTFNADPKVARFLSAMSTEMRRRNRQLTVDFLCAQAGGPTFYTGPNMKSAHAGLGISAGDWKASMAHVERALKKFNVPAKESKEFVALFERTRKQIVER
jgi:hemoglobin